MGIALLTASFGLLGVLVGSLITVLYETARTKDANERADALAAKDEAATRKAAVRMVYMEMAANLAVLRTFAESSEWWDEGSLQNAVWLKHQETIARLLNRDQWIMAETAYAHLPFLELARATAVREERTDELHDLDLAKRAAVIDEARKTLEPHL